MAFEKDKYNKIDLKGGSENIWKIENALISAHWVALIYGNIIAISV